MTMEYDVRIAEQTYRIRIEMPAWHDVQQEDVREFAISTALLEHCGYLPRGVVSGLA